MNQRKMKHDETNTNKFYMQFINVSTSVTFRLVSYSGAKVADFLLRFHFRN